MSRARRILDDQAGFALIEALAAAVVIAVGLLALLGALASGSRLTGEAKRTEQATAVAQRALGAIKALDYSDVALAATPLHETTGPNSKLAGTGAATTFTSGPPVAAENVLVDTGLDGRPGQVAAAPEAFTSGSTSGVIYRYVTRRRECGLTCVDQMDSKRVTVAVWLNTSRNRRAAPTFVSTVVTDPNSGPLGVNVDPPTANPGTGPPVTAQPFYLYDTPCNHAEREPLTGAHAAHDTSSAGASCTSSSKQDLMGVDAPPDATAALPDLSTDLVRANAQGRALVRTATNTCPTTGDRTTVHTWATPPLTTFVATTRSALSLWSRTVGSVAAGATLCATLRTQGPAVLGVTPPAVTVATTTHTLATWPAEPTPVGFAFDHLAFTVPPAGRLLLTVSVRQSSGADLELFYDHPDQRSFLSVSTTTPVPG